MSPSRKKRAAKPRSHMSLATFEREARLADLARGAARLPGVAPDRTAVRRRKAKRTAAASVPSSVDLLLDSAGNRAGTDVRDQKDTNSCTANAVISAMETFFFAESGVKRPLSAAHAFDVAKKTEEMSVAVLVAANGILEEECFPPASKCAPPKEHTWRGNFRLLTESDEARRAAMREHLAAKKPLVGVIRLYKNFKDFNKKDVFQHEGQALAKAHAMAIIGFESNSGGGGAWICRNSFGKGWGDQGYVKIAFDDDFLELERIVYVLENIIPPT